MCIQSEDQDQAKCVTAHVSRFEIESWPVDHTQHNYPPSPVPWILTRKSCSISSTFSEGYILCSKRCPQSQANASANDAYVLEIYRSYLHCSLNNLTVSSKLQT